MASKSKKPLKFLHISKNAGTTIENVAMKAGVLWGRFDDELKQYLVHQEFGFFWHYPVSAYKPEFFEECDVFVVVRNPYERAVGELFWEFQEEGKTLSVQTLSPDDFNTVLQKRVQAEHPKRVGHWLPQVDYVFREGEQVVRHVLKYEELPENFDALMKEYALPVRFSDERYNVSKKIYSVKDLSPESIACINKVYSRDFEAFGYERL